MQQRIIVQHRDGYADIRRSVTGFVEDYLTPEPWQFEETLDQFAAQLSAQSQAIGRLVELLASKGQLSAVEVAWIVGRNETPSTIEFEADA
jgi:hypothetical protein